YANTCRTVTHVRQYGASDGQQLLSAILFFVPRSSWPEKSVGSGYFIFEKSGSQYRNICSPLVAEGYINFKWMGVVLFSVLFALIASFFDKNQGSNKTNVVAFKIFYPAILVLSFLWLRGDLMSGLALSSSVIFSIILLMLALKMAS